MTDNFTIKTQADVLERLAEITDNVKLIRAYCVQYDRELSPATKSEISQALGRLHRITNGLFEQVCPQISLPANRLDR